MRYASPLRYPGGKARLAGFFKQVFDVNGLNGGEYAEPYAGGAGLALRLLFDGYASKIHLNDLDPAIFAFWYAVLCETDELIKLILDTPVTIEEWRKQVAVQKRRADTSLLELGFSTFYLNRTNRSGIIGSGSVIGGLDQSGDWKLDARFNKENLVRRIQRIADSRDQIVLYNLDAAEFISAVLPSLPTKTLLYADPPYYEKGRRLYQHSYDPEDHALIAELISKLEDRPWIVSYDNQPVIKCLYQEFRTVEYSMRYSAATRYEGRELMVFSDRLIIPEGVAPVTGRGIGVSAHNVASVRET